MFLISSVVVFGLVCLQPHTKVALRLVGRRPCFTETRHRNSDKKDILFFFCSVHVYTIRLNCRTFRAVKDYFCGATNRTSPKERTFVSVYSYGYRNLIWHWLSFARKCLQCSFAIVTNDKKKTWYLRPGLNKNKLKCFFKFETFFYENNSFKITATKTNLNL